MNSRRCIHVNRRNGHGKDAAVAAAVVSDVVLRQIPLDGSGDYSCHQCHHLLSGVSDIISPDC